MGNNLLKKLGEGGYGDNILRYHSADSFPLHYKTALSEKMVQNWVNLGSLKANVRCQDEIYFATG